MREDDDIEERRRFADIVDLPMGEGTIAREKIPEELRVVRHNVRNLKAVQEGQITLLRDAIHSSSEARTIAEEAREESRTAITKLATLDYDLFGHPDRKEDTGALGRMTSTLRRQEAQNWAILTAVIGLVGVVLLAGILHH